MTLAEQIAEAQQIFASWPPDVRAAIRLEGRDYASESKRENAGAPKPGITDAERYHMWRKMWTSGDLAGEDGPIVRLADALGGAMNEAHVDAIIDAAIREESSRNG